MKTTLNKIRAYQPCKICWEKLLKNLGKSKADDEPLSILTILDSNGLNNALWCTRAVTGRDKEIRLYTVWCARQAQHPIKDQYSLKALDVAERFALGKATEEELESAKDMASDAIESIDDAAWSVMWALEWDLELAAAYAALAAPVFTYARDAQAVQLRKVCNEVFTLFETSEATKENPGSSGVNSPSIDRPWPEQNGICAGPGRGFDNEPDGHAVLLNNAPSEFGKMQDVLKILNYERYGMNNAYPVDTGNNTQSSPERYGSKQIARELIATALGRAYYGNALYVAQDIPGLTNEERMVICRWLDGSQGETDMHELQSIAHKISGGKRMIMNLIEYVFLVIPAVLFVAVVAAVIIFVLEDCEHLLSRGKGQGHE